MNTENATTEMVNANTQNPIVAAEVDAGANPAGRKRPKGQKQSRPDAAASGESQPTPGSDNLVDFPARRTGTPAKDKVTDPNYRRSREAIVTNWVNSTADAATALHELRTYCSKAIVAEFGSFQKYCYVTWGYKKSQGYRIAEYGEFLQAVREHSPIGESPRSESHFRPLLKLEKKDRLPTWMAIVAEAPSKDVTAAMVAQMVRKRLGPSCIGIAASETGGGSTTFVLPPATTVTGTAAAPSVDSVAVKPPVIDVSMSSTAQTDTVDATVIPAAFPASVAAVESFPSTPATRQEQKRRCEAAILLAIDQLEHAFALHPDAEEFGFYVRKFRDTYSWALRKG
jgi:hypothetical protein